MNGPISEVKAWFGYKQTDIQFDVDVDQFGVYCQNELYAKDLT